MTTATQEPQADVHSVPLHVGAAPASRRQVRLASVLVAVLAAATIVGAIALGRGDHPASGRFAVPHFNDPQVVKGARGGTFGDPDVRKGAAGAPLR